MTTDIESTAVAMLTHPQAKHWSPDWIRQRGSGYFPWDFSCSCALSSGSSDDFSFLGPINTLSVCFFSSFLPWVRNLSNLSCFFGSTFLPL